MYSSRYTYDIGDCSYIGATELHSVVIILWYNVLSHYVAIYIIIIYANAIIMYYAILTITLLIIHFKIILIVFCIVNSEIELASCSSNIFNFYIFSHF